MRVRAKPIDQVITSGQEQWYVLEAQDGTGYIRIGATGPIVIDDAPYKEGEKWGNGGSHSYYGPPQNGADLVEISKWSITEMALIWKVKQAYLKITTPSGKPVAYRISFVSEMPEYRAGGAYGPNVTAREFLFGVASGDKKALYGVTRTHYTDELVTELRQKLYGTKEPVHPSFEHCTPEGFSANGVEFLHVQHFVFSNERDISEKKHWAFRVICEMIDGLWLVVQAEVDPEMSQKQLEEIVGKDLNKGRTK